MKASAADKINVTQKIELCNGMGCNIVRKAFSTLHTMFSVAFFLRVVKVGIVW